MASLEAIRGRAACAAAAAGDSNDNINSNCCGSSYRYDIGCNREDRVNDYLASSAALEAALEATDVSDDKLRDLARALVQEATTAFSSSHLLGLRREHAAAFANDRRCCLASWTAVARAMTTLLWPPPPLSMSPASGDNSDGGVQLLRRWNGLRSPVPCKHLITAGCGSPVTCLSYLPLSMLLVSGYADGRVRLWDPCARRHKLAPPPPPPLHAQGRGGIENQSHYGTRERGRGRDRARHLRLSPGVYAATAEEWTERGQTFGCVATFFAVPLTKASGGPQGGDPGGDGGRSLPVQAVDSIVIPGGGGVSLVVCDTESMRAAQAMDEDEPWDPSSAGERALLCTFLGDADAGVWP